MAAPAPSAHRREYSSQGTLPALLILLLTAALSLLWSHARLMWNDEFLSFYSDAAPTLADVLRVQLRTPISLDPPTYHLLSHLAMAAVGRNSIALRLPALAGFLLLQWSLFVLVRRLAGYRAALLAMLLPLCTASFRYSVEGRPYGLLLGLNAASLTCWFLATQPFTNYEEAGSPSFTRSARERWVQLLGLFLSIALAITSHYFGLLILLPIAIGEALRTVHRRQIDWPVALTLAGGLASIALIVPGKAALAPYQRHYYTGNVNLHNVSQGYREIFIRYTAWPIPVQHVIAAAMALATLGLLWTTVQRFRKRPQDQPAWLYAALLTLAVLPFFGFLFGKFVTHTMEVRYVMAALIPFVVCLALVVEENLRRTAAFRAVISLTLIAVITLTAVQIYDEQQKSSRILAGLAIPATLHDELAHHPAERIYTQSLGDFFLDGYYAPDPLLRERITLVYDETSEVRWLRHNTNAVTASNLQHFTTLRSAPYEQVLGTANALLLNYSSGWEWIGNDLRARRTPQQALGTAAGATLTRLNPR